MAKRKPSREESAPGLARLPRGRHGLPADFVASNQRGRLINGMIGAVVEHGYNGAGIAQITAKAGVQEFTVVGIAKFAGNDSSLGATWALFDLPTAQAFVAQAPSQVDAITVRGDGSLSQTALAQRIEQALLAIPAVVACYLVSGADDFLIEAAVPDLGGYERLLLDELLAIPGVTEARSTFAIRTVLSRGPLPLGHWR